MSESEKNLIKTDPKNTSAKRQRGGAPDIVSPDDVDVDNIDTDTEQTFPTGNSAINKDIAGENIENGDKCETGNESDCKSKNCDCPSGSYSGAYVYASLEREMKLK